jgi:hypothetical protein
MPCASPQNRSLDSEAGQSLLKTDVRVRSAFPLMATKSRTSNRGGDGPERELGYLIVLGEIEAMLTAIPCAWDWARRGGAGDPRFVGLFYLPRVFKNFKSQLREDASKIVVLLTTCPGR